MQKLAVENVQLVVSHAAYDTGAAYGLHYYADTVDACVKRELRPDTGLGPDGRLLALPPSVPPLGRGSIS